MFGLSWVLCFDELNESTFELLTGFLDVFLRVVSVLSDPLLMRMRVDVAFETIFIFALFAAELAEVFESTRRHSLINTIKPTL